MTKRITGLLAVLLLCVSSVLVPVHAEEGNAEFDQFMEDLFIEQMEADFMTMHFALADYKASGIEKPERIIGKVSMEDYADSVEYAQGMLDRLQKFDYASLSDIQKHDYDTVKFDLENEIALNKYPMFDFAFTPTEGIINNLLTNFTEYVFREKEDIDDYLDVLASTPQFLAECMELTKTQEAAGYFMTEAALEETLEQIDSFTGKTEDNQLIIIFDENIDAFAGLSDAEKEQYKQRNRDIVLNQYIPAYQKTGEELAAMKGSCRPTDAGLCSLQGGREYYAAKARAKTSTDKTVEELLDECKAFVETTLEEYISIYRKNPAVITSDESVDLSTPEETLAYLQAHLQDYPEGPEVSYTAKYLDPSVANAGVVAYYLNPPLDDLKDNVIKINGASVGDTTKLYETLAHEGFPGHLYQITWYLNTKPARARYQLNMLGYTEGWAMYSEMRAYEFSGMSDDYARMCALDTALNYVLDCAVDLGVNGLGWTEKEVEQMLDELGLNSSIAGDLVDFVTSDPAVLLPYGIGLMKFETMYADAKAALGDSFSLKEFHRVMLENGARPFDLVRADMNTWLESQGKTAPSPIPAKQTDWMPWMIGGALIAVLIIVFLAQRSFRKSA